MTHAEKIELAMKYVASQFSSVWDKPMPTGPILPFPHFHQDTWTPMVAVRDGTPEGEALAAAEAKESKKLQDQADALARKALLDQPHFQAARSIASEIEWNIDSVIERLTPQEWIDLKAKIVDQA